MDMMNSGAEERAYREEMIAKYQPEVDKLVPYLPWLEEKLGEAAYRNYDLDDLQKSSVSFPVYDSTLLSLVNTANATTLMNPNYVYIYSRNRLVDDEAEIRFIQDCDSLAALADLAGILSKYVLKGMSKGVVWSEGVKNGAFYYTIQKMQQILKKYS